MTRTLLFYAIIPTIAALAIPATAAPPIHSSETQSSRTDDTAASCIDVEVNGERIPDYTCLSRALSDPTGSNVTGPSQALPGSEEIVRRPPTRLGIVTPEATRQRMGNTFGKSTLPQRPEQPPPALPPAIRRP